MSIESMIRKKSPLIESQIKAIAESTTAGVWRIKRAKIILGLWKGLTVDELVLLVRVPPESVERCRDGFAAMGLAFFDLPPRKPTLREARVERVLELLNDPPHPKAEQWKELTVRYIGRDFTATEIWELRNFIDAHPEATRRSIAEELCKKFGLYHLDGKPRKAIATDMLKRMAMDNIIRLPSLPIKKLRKAKRELLIKQPCEHRELSQEEIPTLRFTVVDTQEQSVLWREMIERFHYIKASRLFGRRLRYLVYGGSDESKLEEQQLLAALAYGPSVWSLKSRDNFIGWASEVREKNLHLVVNNVRFLILPWIRSKNLASRILGGIARKMPTDWESRYQYRPVLLETFVQLDRHKGISYRAANWIQVGTTDGYSLYSSKRKNVPEKAVFLYPLQRHYLRILRRGPTDSSNAC